MKTNEKARILDYENNTSGLGCINWKLNYFTIVNPTVGAYNFGLKSVGTNSEWERGALGSRDVREEVTLPILLWGLEERRELSQRRPGPKTGLL